MKVLDTTFLIDVLRGRPETRAFLESDEPFLTTQINMYEIIKGLFYEGASPEKFLKVQDLFKNIRVLQLDDQAIITAASICADLFKKGEPIEDCDCLIAGIALSNNISHILTRNDKHFKKIKRLKVETY